MCHFCAQRHVVLCHEFCLLRAIFRAPFSAQFLLPPFPTFFFFPSCFPYLIHASCLFPACFLLALKSFRTPAEGLWQSFRACARLCVCAYACNRFKDRQNECSCNILVENYTANCLSISDFTYVGQSCHFGWRPLRVSFRRHEISYPCSATCSLSHFGSKHKFGK